MNSFNKNFKMRIAVFFVFSLLSNNVLTEDSISEPQISAFDCEELTSRIQELKRSTPSKKEQFSCILNLLKSALTDELENSKCQESKDTNPSANPSGNVLEQINDSQATVEITEHKNAAVSEKDLYDRIPQVSDKSKTSRNNTKYLDVPTMIPIFKPRPVIRDGYDDSLATRTRSIVPEADHTNLNSMHNSPKFTIPCQRATDILDMSIALPRSTEKVMQNVQPNLKPISSASSPVLRNQTPTTVSVHCADLDESVAIVFKPKAISLIQVYGNLLKKITLTVLVPYHMSKMGQKQ